MTRTDPADRDEPAGYPGLALTERARDGTIRVVDPADPDGDAWIEASYGEGWARALMAIRQARRSFDGLDHFRDVAEGELEQPAGLDDYNTGYANYAVVVMDADHVDAAVDHAGVIREAGVGLASLDRDQLTVHVEPERHQQELTRSRLELNEAALRNGSP